MSDHIYAKLSIKTGTLRKKTQKPGVAGGKKKSRGWSLLIKIMTNTEEWVKVPELYLLCRAAGVQRLQVSFPGRNGNRVLVSRITTPHTLYAEHTRPKNNKSENKNLKNNKNENEEVGEQKRNNNKNKIQTD